MIFEDIRGEAKLFLEVRGRGPKDRKFDEMVADFPGGKWLISRDPVLADAAATALGVLSSPKVRWRCASA